MTSERLFSILNMVTMVAWLPLLFLPRSRWATRVVPLAVPLLLAAVYVALMILALSGSDGASDGVSGSMSGSGGGFSSLAVVPVLVLTFLLGPAGWLLYLAIRSFVRTKGDERVLE